VLAFLPIYSLSPLLSLKRREERLREREYIERERRENGKQNAERGRICRAEKRRFYYGLIRIVGLY
jgi:hypothetical protein